MSLRDAMAQRMDELWPHGPDFIADALMPLVERAVLNAAAAGWSMAEGSGTDADFEVIVADILK